MCIKHFYATSLITLSCCVPCSVQQERQKESREVSEGGGRPMCCWGEIDLYVAFSAF